MTRTSGQGLPSTSCKRALNEQNVVLADLARGELEAVPLYVALKMVHLDASKGNRNRGQSEEPVPRRWLSRSIAQEQPSVDHRLHAPCGVTARKRSVEESVRAARPLQPRRPWTVS